MTSWIRMVDQAGKVVGSGATAEGRGPSRQGRPGSGPSAVAWEKEAAPRSVIRGADCHSGEWSIGTHNLRGTVRGDGRAVQGLFDHWFGIGQIIDHGMDFYRSRVVYAGGKAKILRDGIADAEGTACVIVDGELLEGLEADGCRRLFVDLFGLGFSCTRVDVKGDDPDQVVTPEEVHAAAERGEVVGYRRRALVRGGEVGESEDDGATCYLGLRGKKGSGKFLRTYDKTGESDGAVDAVRWEIEFTKERAREVFDQLANSGTAREFELRCGKFLGGCVDFVNRTSKHLDRCERLGWWAAIVEKLGEAKVCVRRAPSSVLKMQAWLDRGVAPTLACVVKALVEAGSSVKDAMGYVTRLVRDGGERLSPRHEEAIERFVPPRAPADLLEMLEMG